MDRIQTEIEYDYRLEPKPFPISANDPKATYDQFITLRDTLVMSNKYYGDKAGRSLIIGTKLDGTPTDTIEIWEPNIMSMTFEPGGTTNSDGSTWQYVETWWHTGTNPISCEIIKTGRYRIQHKEQFNNLTTTRVHSYVIWHRASWGTQDIAVFDWEWNTPWEIKRLTAFWYREVNLDNWDWLELKVEDNNGSIISETAYDSNWWMVEYIDLAY